MKSKTSFPHDDDIIAVKLKLVSKSDHKFLYDLLGERHSNTNIFHKKMPSYNEHQKFVMSKPYSKWYVIKYKNQNAGSVYLTKYDEIGIFIKNGFQGKGLGKTALHLLIKANPRPRYLANVNPKNLNSIKFFKKNRFKLIQYTYELISNNAN